MIENKWEVKHYVDLYKECLKPEHDVRVLGTGWGSQLMYCVNCDKVWWLKCGYGTKLSVIDAGSVVSEGLRVMVDGLRKRIGC